MFIRTERLFLRPGWAEDETQLLALIDDEAIVRNLARAPWPYTLDDARQFIALPQDRSLPHFFITLPTASGPKLIGSAGLGSHEGEAEIGYWIGRDYWGNGYATEAARGVLSLARTLGHQRLRASHYVDNPASGKVLQKLGFAPTGRIITRDSAGRGELVKSVEFTLTLSDALGADPDQRGKMAA